MKRLGFWGAGLALAALPAMSTAAVNVLHNGDFSTAGTQEFGLSTAQHWGLDKSGETRAFGSGFRWSASDLFPNSHAPLVGTHVLAMSATHIGGQILRDIRIDEGYKYELQGHLSGHTSSSLVKAKIELGYALFDDVHTSFVSLAESSGTSNKDWIKLSASTQIESGQNDFIGRQLMVQITVDDVSDEALFDDFSLIVSPASAEPIPEPLTLLALGLGAAGWAARRRRA